MMFKNHSTQCTREVCQYSMNRLWKWMKVSVNFSIRCTQTHSLVNFSKKNDKTLQLSRLAWLTYIIYNIFVVTFSQSWFEKAKSNTASNHNCLTMSILPDTYPTSSSSELSPLSDIAKSTTESLSEESMSSGSSSWQYRVSISYIIISRTLTFLDNASLEHHYNIMHQICYIQDPPNLWQHNIILKFNIFNFIL